MVKKRTFFVCSGRVTIYVWIYKLPGFLFTKYHDIFIENLTSFEFSTKFLKAKSDWLVSGRTKLGRGNQLV